MLLQIGLLVVGFVLLIKGADWLVEGASSLAKRLGVRDLVIGLTIVAFGTSAPELIVNLFSALSGNTSLALGNIVGSNIVNILLILGISAIIYPLAVTHGTVWKEIPLSLLAALAVFILINDTIIDGASASLLTRIDGFVMLLFFIIFLYYTYGISRIEGQKMKKGELAPRHSLTVALAMIVGGLFGLVGGGYLIVENATALALALGVSQSLIGLTIVAVGTSLPELATSAVAAYRKNADIAVGNIVGSNIFNIFFILAITSIISPLADTPQLNIDLAVMILASALLFVALFIGRRHLLERWQGVGFLLLYAAYISYLVWRG
jgi:cation:H+ antiporter